MKRTGADRSFYHRLTIGGVSVVAFGMALYAAIAIPAGDPQAPLFVPGFVVVVGLVAALRRTPKALWIPLVAGPPALVTTALDPFRLLHPDSFVDFWPSVLVLAGTATAFVSSAVALTQRRRGTERRATRLERAAVGAGSLGLVALAALSAVLTFTARATVTLPSGVEAIVVSAADDHWVPSALEVPAGRATTLVVRNPDWFAHTFTIAELGIDTYLGPRSERTIEVRPAHEGGYRLTCDVTGHWDMVGTLRAT